MSHEGHERIEWACGHVKMECRCPSYKPMKRLSEPCPSCVAKGGLAVSPAAVKAVQDAGLDAAFPPPGTRAPTAGPVPPKRGKAESKFAVLNLGRVEIHRWWKNGDHPNDAIGEEVEEENGTGRTYTRVEGRIVRFYRVPGISTQRCTRCEGTFHNHGWIDSGGAGRVVCPGDWIATPYRGVNLPLSNDFVEALLALPFEVEIQSAQEVVESLGAHDEVADNSTLRGLFLAAAGTLKQAQAIVDENE